MGLLVGLKEVIGSNGGCVSFFLLSLPQDRYGSDILFRYI